jgi:hypothetical protein
VRKLLAISAVMISASAWATGERIAVPQGTAVGEQLQQTLCISMECGPGVDGSVTVQKQGRTVKIQLVAPSGAVKTVLTGALNDQDRLSSIELVSVTSQLVRAIESPTTVTTETKTKPKAEKTKKSYAKKAKKKSSTKVAAKVRAPKNRG